MKPKRRTNIIIMICMSSKCNFEHDSIICCAPKQKSHIFPALTEAIGKVKTSFLRFYKPN